MTQAGSILVSTGEFEKWGQGRSRPENAPMPRLDPTNSWLGTGEHAINTKANQSKITVALWTPSRFSAQVVTISTSTLGTDVNRRSTRDPHYSTTAAIGWDQRFPPPKLGPWHPDININAVERKKGKISPRSPRVPGTNITNQICRLLPFSV